MALFKRMIAEGVDDLTMVSSPGNSELAGQLGARYARQLIYTNIGEVLISCNPYTRLPIYGPDHIRMYQSSSGREAPHVYALAETAYRRMLADGENQAVIISGESGAGKTEAAKLILNYISSVSGGSGDSQRVKEVIYQCNPLLEAFGNAKTVRNDNSSRFGKYLEVQFNQAGEPIGGVTSIFLLEKTRVAFQQKGERNFHCFYDLVRGCDQSLRDEFQLGGPEHYFYTSQGHADLIDGINDAEEYGKVCHAMQTVGISGDDQYYIWRFLAAILHLGNIQFQGEAPAQPTDNYSLEMAAYLFGLEKQTLLGSLNHRQITTGSRTASVYYVPQNADQSAQIRDALGKEVYARLFDFVVAKVNASMKINKGVQNLVGILDIYGFEIFERNSFEQFCINYVNEKLQQIFIDLTIRSEQAEYHDEGMPWKDIKFFDNLVVCELIEGKSPPGIMRVLDDVCRTVHAVDSQTADAKFMEKMVKSLQNEYLSFQQSSNGHYTHFTIQHYAGEVQYDVAEFCFKNVDSLYQSLVACVATSNLPFVRTIWPDAGAGSKQAQAPSTSGTKIRTSAEKLITALRACTPHYIRCIKPNDRKAALVFDSGRVTHQVKYLGLLENVRVKQAGYSYRHFYNVFYQRFSPLGDGMQSHGDVGAQCRALVSAICATYKDVSASEFGFGRSKIFVRTPDVIFKLEEYRFAKVDPEGYKMRIKEYEVAEKEAKKAQGKYGLKPKCLVM